MMMTHLKQDPNDKQWYVMSPPGGIAALGPFDERTAEHIFWAIRNAYNLGMHAVSQELRRLANL